MSDDRSERLRQRRKQSQDHASDDSQRSTDASQPDGDTESDDGSVKAEQVGTYMYLPQSQKKELERLYNVIKAEYEYEYDDQFEKNRAFYPLVVKYGFERLESFDISEIREEVQNLS